MVAYLAQWFWLRWQSKAAATGPLDGAVARASVSFERLEDRLAPAAGELDPSFGLDGNGKVTTDFEASSDTGNAVALQADGKIIVVGSTNSGGGGTNFAVARYLADGTLDPSFSGDGKVATDFAGGNDEAFGVAIQATARSSWRDATVGSDNRFRPGPLQPRRHPGHHFGTTHGKVTTDFGGGFDHGLQRGDPG